jgi:Ppx/GppA phosphatase family
LLLAGGCRTAEPRAAPGMIASPASAKVVCRPERDRPIAADPQRRRRCVIDVGSRNVKLVVASAMGDDARSLIADRTCRSRLQLGEKTFDQKTQSARALDRGDQEELARLLAEYAALCARDGAEMVGAIATEWARRATNPDEIRTTMAARARLDLAILSRESEARFGYLSATRGARGKVVLDFGSRSLQISSWARGAPAPEAASLALGIDEAGDQFLGKPEFRGYAPARAALVAALRAGLGPSLERVRASLRAGALDPELISVGENGDLPLALAGKLWDRDTRRGVDEARYSALLRTRTPATSASFGTVTAVLSARDLATFAAALDRDPKLFEELRSSPVRRIYGYKMLAVPAVVQVLAEDLGIETVVLVPQDMPDGLIVDHLQR